jgi:hypothetical protein
MVVSPFDRLRSARSQIVEKCRYSTAKPIIAQNTNLVAEKIAVPRTRGSVRRASGFVQIVFSLIDRTVSPAIPDTSAMAHFTSSRLGCAGCPILFIVLFTKLCVYAKKGRMSPTFLLRTFSKFPNSSSNFGPSDPFDSRVHKDRSSFAFMTRSKMTLQCTVPHIRFDFKSGKYGNLPTANPGLSEFAVITARRLALLPECRQSR